MGDIIGGVILVVFSLIVLGSINRRVRAARRADVEVEEIDKKMMADSQAREEGYRKMAADMQQMQAKMVTVSGGFPITYRAYNSSVVYSSSIATAPYSDWRGPGIATFRPTPPPPPIPKTTVLQRFPNREEPKEVKRSLTKEERERQLIF